MTRPSLAEQFGKLLEGTRTKDGISRRALAVQLGAADPNLLKYEHGHANPTLRKVEALAAEYGLELTITAKRLPKRR